jgi:hypothetical protein
MVVIIMIVGIIVLIFLNESTKDKKETKVELLHTNNEKKYDGTITILCQVDEIK